jgi:hypothetical protein
MLSSAVPWTAQANTALPDQKQKPCREFLLFGTVFRGPGFALPGAEIAVRRAGEKKVRWRAQSDARGEFAVCVPPGAEYEMTVTAKGFREETRKADARQGAQGDRADFVFLMKREAKDKAQ